MADIIILKDYLNSLLLPASSRGQKRYSHNQLCLQGDLDSLCGIYCIINAVGRVCRLKSSYRQELFDYLIKALDKEISIRKVISSGIEKKYMRWLFIITKRWVKLRYGKTLIIEPIFEAGRSVSLYNYCETLRVFLNKEKQAVIIGIDGIHNHWTCVAAVTQHAMRLVDSDKLTMLRLDYCRLSNKATSNYHYLGTARTWGISLKD